MNVRLRSVAIMPVEASAMVMALLEQGQLPVADLASSPALQLFGAFDGESLIGVIGLELYPPVALLRSLAIDSEHRASGFGKALVDFAEQQASAQGIDTLYLLTTTAARFFTRLGYRQAARSDAPQSIQATAQFAGLCPSSSAFMTKRLSR